MAETTVKKNTDAQQGNSKPAAPKKTASRPRARKKAQVTPAVSAIVPIYNMDVSVLDIVTDKSEFLMKVPIGEKMRIAVEGT